jgi:EmrB/QacA subfamily drug resistance transporter
MASAISDAWWRPLLAEPRRPERVRSSPRAAWFVVGTVCVGAFMGQLDASIVTVALPRIAFDLHAAAPTVEWVSLSYLLVLVSALAAVGRLADRLGRKLLYVYGFGVFTVGSLLCALAPGLGWLVAARVLQGLGAALLQANGIALIREAVPESKLGRALGFQGTAQALGLALGPAVGGALVSLGGWRTLFLVNVPAGLIGGALGWVLLPRSRFRDSGSSGRFDLAGAVLLAGAAGGALLLLSRLGSLGLVSLSAVAVGSLVLGAGFVFRSRHAASPLIDLRLIAERRIWSGLAGAAVSFTVMFGALFAIPFYLAASHVSAAVAGLELAVLPVALGVVAPFAGRVSDRCRRPWLTAAPLVVAGLGLAVVALWHGTAGVVLGLAIAGAGLGAFIPANNATIMGSVAVCHAGVLSGVLSMVRGLGTALGVAVAGLVYSGVGAPGRALTATLLVLAGLAAVAGLALRSQPNQREVPRHS